MPEKEECQQCNLWFSIEVEEYNTIRHIIHCHVDKPLKCLSNGCNKTFVDHYFLEQHNSASHLGEKENFKDNLNEDYINHFITKALHCFPNKVAYLESAKDRMLENHRQYRGADMVMLMSLEMVFCLKNRSFS
ncbi:unnamed protein product, partial [Mesorhabditis belari]|uniref:C2H2-type domain-containing protein n=1 Tax=Mesorhabditis belari TaxID=2138241 RepID=A0AAF3EKE4_9BILA